MPIFFKTPWRVVGQCEPVTYAEESLKCLPSNNHRP